MKWEYEHMHPTLRAIAQEGDNKKLLVTLQRYYDAVRCSWVLAESPRKKLTVFDVVCVARLEGITGNNPRLFISCTKGKVGFFFDKGGACITIDKWGDMMIYATGDMTGPKRHYCNVFCDSACYVLLHSKVIPRDMTYGQVEAHCSVHEEATW